MKDKMIIVVDLGLVKAYRIDLTPQKTRRLEPVQEIVLEEAHTRLKDRVTDWAGRHRAPTQKNHSAPMADDHNLKLEAKPRLIRKIAGTITDLIKHNAKNGCWLTAPKEINPQILNELLPPIGQRSEKTVPCDYTKLSPPECVKDFLHR